MRAFLLLTACLAYTICLQAQSNKTGFIKGRLIDSVAKQNLKATITVLSAQDSTLESYTLSKEDGSFQINNISLGKHLLHISHTGYEAITRVFTLTEDRNSFDFGTIYLLLKANDLGNVTVVQSPIVIKNDTTEFNASSFKTRPNATAEDLLKKLPGVQVDRDGNIKAQGEQVQKVLVDGKRFFGNDPKMATKNLPSEIIDKVQVYDAQTEQSAFSGFDDGNREKTINIITKKDKRKGYFGKAAAGVGENERYAANLSVNRFNGNQQISLIAQANNTNQQNFSIQDLLGVMNTGGGGMMGMFGGGGGGRSNVSVSSSGGARGGGFSGIGNFLSSSTPGVATTYAAGLNYNDAWSKNTSVSGSYFYNNLDIITNQDKLTQSLLATDSSIFRKEDSYSDRKNGNHRFNFEIDQRIDSFTSVLIRPTFSSQDNDSYSETFTNITRGKLGFINNTTVKNHTTTNGYNFSNSILLRRRFGKKGRTVSINFTHGLSSNDGRTTTDYVGYDSTAYVIRYSDREADNYGVNLSYTEPVGKKAMFEITYAYNYNKNNSNQNAYLFDALLNAYVNNNVLSNDFRNLNTSYREGINYRRQINKDWSYTVGMAVQQTTLTSVNRTKNVDLAQDFINYFPSLQIQYSKNRVNNLRFNYRGSTSQPSVTQLQDVPDLTNPLYITNGNPALKQQFTHNFNLFYSKINIFTFKNIFASVNFAYTHDKIANSTVIAVNNMVIDNVPLARGAQYSKPVNINGAYNLSAFFNVGFPVKKPKSNINFTTTVLHNRDINLLNGIENITRNYILGELITYNINVKEQFDLNFTSSSNYTIARYSLQPQINGDYFYQTFSAEPTYSTKSGWVASLDFDYSIYTGQAAGFNQSVPLLNASISKLMFKNKAGELKLSVFDLLNQNQSISRTVELNNIVDTRTNVLQRYVMLTFTYNLRKFGQGAMPPFMNMFRRMPGGVRVGM